MLPDLDYLTRLANADIEADDEAHAPILFTFMGSEIGLDNHLLTAMLMSYDIRQQRMIDYIRAKNKNRIIKRISYRDDNYWDVIFCAELADMTEDQIQGDLMQHFIQHVCTKS